MRGAHRHPPAGDLRPLLGLSDAMLKDIGAPEGLRSAAAWRREQAAVLRQLDMLRASGPLRW